MQRTYDEVQTNAGDPWARFSDVCAPALALAPTTFLDDLRKTLTARGISQAVTTRDTRAIFDWIMGLVSLQGISDRIATRYAEQHGGVSHAEIIESLRRPPTCQRLTSYWHFEGCGYRKAERSCAEPHHLATCPLPVPRLRKGSLNQAAYGLALFIRDVCDGDLVDWIDRQLAEADLGVVSPERGVRLREAVLGPLCEVYGIGPKLWAMILADLLLGADPNREQWVTVGAWMVAVDSLVHNFLHRTGTLARFGGEHPYGTACTAPSGCRELIEGLACRIDAQAYNPGFPAIFPRFIQAALWGFCAEGGWGICNGNRIDDRRGCRELRCPAYSACDRCGIYYSKRSARKHSRWIGFISKAAF